MERPISAELNPHIKPPQRWHDAIRNNFEGSQLTPDRFVTLPIELESGLIYTIHSLTSDEAEKGNPEGIYIDTNIPESMVHEAALLVLPIIKSIREALLDNENVTVRFLISTPDPAISVSIEPAGNINEKDIEKETAIMKIFEELNYFERMRYAARETRPLEIRKGILKTETANEAAVIKGWLETDVIFKSEMNLLQNDLNLQEKYKSLMDRIIKHNTKEEQTEFTIELRSMSPLQTAGWFEFCRKYWEEKLGEKLI